MREIGNTRLSGEMLTIAQRNTEKRRQQEIEGKKEINRGREGECKIQGRPASQQMRWPFRARSALLPDSSLSP